MAARKAPRVAIITSNYWPERTGIGQVTTEFAEFLAAKGVAVTVATAMPYYPEWSIYPQYKGRAWATETHNGVVIHRAVHYASPTPSSFGRILHEATLCLMSLPNILAALKGAKTAFVISPDLSHAFVASATARLMGVRLRLIVQDIMPDAAVEMGMLTNKFVVGVSRKLALANYEMAETIYTLSEGMKARIGKFVGAAKNIEVLPNTIDPEELAPGLDQGRLFRDRFVPEGTFAVVHTGNMGEKQDLFLLLRTARRLLDTPDIHFFVFGDGAVKSSFLRVQEEWNLINVSHFPLQDRAMLPHMLYGADVCLISQLPTVVDVVVPSKLISAMGAQAMIVAACSPKSETWKLIAASGGGLLVEAGDDGALAEVLRSVKRGEVGAEAYRLKARTFALQHFARSAAYRSVLREVTA